MYGAWYSLVLLRLKNKVNLLTQTAEKWICMGKWALLSGAVYFLKSEKIFSVRMLTNSREKRKYRESSLRGGEKNTVSIFFNFCKNDYNSAEDTKFWSMSNFNSSTNFDPLTTNDGALESWHQGEFVLGLLAGSRHNYKNNNLVH